MKLESYRQRRKAAFGAVVVALAILFFAGPSSAEFGAYYTRQGGVMCVSEEALDQAVAYSMQRDQVARDKLFTGKQCFYMRRGVKVYRDKSGAFSGKVRVRFPGTTATAWTLIEHISKKP